MNPPDNVDCLKLVRKAQLGDRESLTLLAELGKERVCAYIHRLTLDSDLAQDLAQETFLEMVESLKRLKFEHPNQFWAWLFRTALGKVQLHYRDKGLRKKTHMAVIDKERSSQLTASDYDNGLNRMIRKELSFAIFESMKKLKLTHRNILILRCIEQLSYSEITSVMGGNELQMRALFFRAKHSLKRHLSRNGFGKGVLLTALGLYAHISAPAKAAPITISAASAKVGFFGSIVGALGTKMAATVTTAVTVSALTTGGIMAMSSKSSKTISNAPSQISKVAFEYPTSLVDAYDPDGNGWKGHDLRGNWPSKVVPDRWLVGPPLSRKSSVVLPEKHWVELKFNGRIVDGPGDDIILSEWGAQRDNAHVFLTDGDGNKFPLGTAEIKPSSNKPILTKVGFDISGIRLPFIPCAVRIVGTDTGKGKIPGFELNSVRAYVLDDKYYYTAKGNFAYPSSLLDTYDPDGDGWKGGDIESNWPYPITPDQWLVGPPPVKESAVILPAYHWVELKFPDRIVDGPGEDIILVEFGGADDLARVFITDGTGNEYPLGRAKIKPSSTKAFTEIGFDISSISPPFIPRGVRIIGIDREDPLPGFELSSVRARMKSD